MANPRSTSGSGKYPITRAATEPGTESQDKPLLSHSPRSGAKLQG